MTIECYFSECKYHSCHDPNEEGPFCYEETCNASEEEIETFNKTRGDFLKRIKQ